MSQPPSVGPIVGPDHHAEAEQRHRRTRFFGRKRLEQHRLRHRHQRAAADALNDAPEDERAERVRRAAEKARRREEDDRADEVALAPEEGAEPAGERDDDDAREDVAGGHPRDLVEVGAEVAHHVGQRDVDDRAVDDLHERREHDREGDEVLVRIAFVLGGVTARRRHRRRCRPRVCSMTVSAT